MPDLLNSLIVGSVPGGERQAILQGDGRNHRIGNADGPSYPLQLASDPSGQLGSGPVERARARDDVMRPASVGA